MFRHFCAHAQKCLGEFECRAGGGVLSVREALVDKDWQIGLFANPKQEGLNSTSLLTTNKGFYIGCGAGIEYGIGRCSNALR